MKSKFWDAFPDKQFCIENMISNLDYQIDAQKKNDICNNLKIEISLYNVTTYFHIQVNYTEERIVKVLKADRKQCGKELSMNLCDRYYIQRSLN